MDKDTLPRLPLVIRALDHVDSFNAPDVELPEHGFNPLLRDVGENARNAQAGNIRRNDRQIESLLDSLVLKRHNGGISGRRHVGFWIRF
jgi:hypothetical protein